MSDNAPRIQRTSRKASLSIEQRTRKRNIQISVGTIIAILMVVLGVYIQSVNPRGAIIWAIGLALGYILQRSRFCFTAALRDPLLTGGTALAKALIITLALSSVGYMAMQMKVAGLGLENLGENLKVTQLPGHVRDAGVHTIIGGFLFGIGAVIAGGCASGTLMRMGEGFLQQWIVIVFFIAGSVLGVALMPLVKASGILYQNTPVYLPLLFGGWVPAIVVHFGLLFGVYIFADWYGKKKSGEL